ncbi:MAG: 50S ribosomal protein L32 [Oligoflexia bacterium]|nr:50S ribosomal protein L32 [Oligoflexia bacterium]
MGVPADKTTKSKRDKRRSHLALSAVNVSSCSNCGELKQPHVVCPHCGYYNGKEIVKAKNKQQN